MSIINDLLEKITGLDLDGSDSEKKTVERPCSNCPSNCAIAGTACTICEPYKKKLIDAVYHVDHLDEYYAQYEVVSQPQAAGSVTHCPRCGASSADPYICEYCGGKLADKPASSGKIQVSAASEIPNPITEAQDIIWDRYAAVVSKSSSEKTGSGSFLSDLFSQLIGTSDETDSGSALGAKMSEAEIKEAAALYKVSVGDYLTGLDNGKYLTLSGKKEADAQGADASLSPASMGLPGMAAIGMMAGSIFSNAGRRWPKDMPQHRPQQSFSREPVSRPYEPQRRPQQTQDTVRPTKPVSRPSVSSDILERPSSSSVRDRDSFRRPSESSRVTPQRSTPSSEGNKPSRERHPENRRSGGSGNPGGRSGRR